MDDRDNCPKRFPRWATLSNADGITSTNSASGMSKKGVFGDGGHFSQNGGTRATRGSYECHRLNELINLRQITPMITFHVIIPQRLADHFVTTTSRPLKNYRTSCGELFCTATVSHVLRLAMTTLINIQ
jgi:hypothetical protein